MKKIIVILSAALLAASCSDFLDMTPRDRVSAKTMWENTRNAEYSVNHLFSYIWGYNSAPTALGLTESLTDEMKYTSYNFNAMAYIPSYIAYFESTVTAQTIDVYLGMWGSLYVAVRETNEAINYLHAYGQMSAEDKTRLEGELRFLRAYFYFELAKRYKDVILYDEDLSKIVKDKAISPEKDIWDFVQADLEYAAANLPAQADARGRIDKGMAYAFTTRAMLYAERWDAVIAAANEVEALGYSLEPNYADACGKSLAAGNREAILQYTFDNSNGIAHEFNFYYTPGGDYAIEDMKGGAYGVPTQELVESYELATGGFPNWAPWHGSTTNTPPYDQLEPRFKATILYNGAPWKGRNIEPFVGGTDGWASWKTDKEPKGKTVTGYYLRKLVDENYDVTTSGSSQPFTFLRYGEVLLNKAEACYRASDNTGANDAVRAIRSRVGLPYSDKTGDNLWKAIVQERKVELAFEGLRYWDLRRWKAAAKAYPEGLSGYQQHGLKIEPDGAGFRYTYVSVDEKNRSFPERLYRFPMPESELSSNSLVEQYDEWK
ncbi:MAG: RagB/SusD family nutrient uptake outer membrane protein [Bacteroidales bacterium]|nr:RagB/SusD family nutrient uptake outer membrane protein [Bacteroidales bacterium]